jgi:hypothetical protein
MSLREAMEEHLSNKNIKQVVSDYILPLYFVILYKTTGMSHLKFLFSLPYGWARGTNTLLTLDIFYISTSQYNFYRLFFVLQHK